MPCLCLTRKNGPYTTVQAALSHALPRNIEAAASLTERDQVGEKALAIAELMGIYVGQRDYHEVLGERLEPSLGTYSSSMAEAVFAPYSTQQVLRTATCSRCATKFQTPASGRPRPERVSVAIRYLSPARYLVDRVSKICGYILPEGRRDATRA